MAVRTFDDAFLHCEVLVGPGDTLIRLRGEVEFAANRTLEAVERLAVEARQPVTVDLSEVSFLDSTGLAFLIGLLAAGRGGGWTVTVVGAQGAVQDTIRVSGLAPVFLTDERAAG